MSDLNSFNSLDLNDYADAQSLPPELLSRVFYLIQAKEGEDEGFLEDNDRDLYENEVGEIERGCTNDDDEVQNERLLLLPMEVRLTHVCRHWRIVAINTPILWTRLDFRKAFNMNKEFIRRSGRSMLDVTIDNTISEDDVSTIYNALQKKKYSVLMTDLDDSKDGEALKLYLAQRADLTRILDLICPHVNRWQRFHLSTSLHIHMPMLLREFAELDEALFLERLELYCYDLPQMSFLDQYRFTEESSFVLFEGRTPKLTQVTLWGTLVDCSILAPTKQSSTVSLRSRSPPPSNTLTTLDLGYFGTGVLSYEQFFEILRWHAASLEIMILTSCGPLIDDNTTIEPLYLPKLRELSFAFQEADYLTRLLRLFYAPGLTKLVLDFDSLGGDYTEFVNCLADPMMIPSRLPPDSPTHIFVSGETLPLNPEQPTSILASVTDLQIKGLPCSTGAQGKLYDACSRTRYLFLDMHELHGAFVYSLTQSEILRSGGAA